MNKKGDFGIGMIAIAFVILSAGAFLLTDPSITGAFSGIGSGSSGDPYVITNCTQLQEMEDDLGANYSLGNNIDCVNTTTWNGGDGFDPVGTSASKFTGSLEGNGYNISNLFIDRSGENDVGLFGHTNLSEINNVSLIDVNITGDYNVGGLIGYPNNATIENCEISGYVGGIGLVGGFGGENYYTKVFDSSFIGRVSTSSGGTGGIFGRSYHSQIINSYSKGNITGGAQSGGLVGAMWNSGSLINNSYSTADITSTNAQTGGLAGTVGVIGNVGQVINCYATGNVIGAGNSVGGLIGDIQGVNVNNSYATGKVSGTSTYIGGLVGRRQSNCAINNSYWYNDPSDSVEQCVGDGTDPCSNNQFERSSESWFYDVTNDVYDTIDPNWDFVDVWDNVYDVYDYPFLSWQDAPPLPCPQMDGLGTASNPCNITNCTQLQAMEDNLDSYYVLNNSINCSDTANWNTYCEPGIPVCGFEPVGTFEGTLDGQGYVVDGLFIGRWGGNYVGLFTETTSSTVIKDIGLVNLTINASARQAGGFAGYNRGIINSSYVIGNLTAGGNSGGLAGNSNGLITNSYFIGIVNGMNGNQIGGLIGLNNGDIFDSYANVSLSGNSNVGGLTGTHNSALINNSFASGSISGNSNMGGLVGRLYSVGTIRNSYYYNFSGNPDACMGVDGGSDVCYGIDTSSYFYDVSNEPLVSWDFVDVWDNASDGSDHPPLQWQGVAGVAQNIPPNVTSVVLTTTDPATNYTTEDLTASVSAEDDDGDNFTLWYNWYKDDVLNATTLIEDDLISYWSFDNDTDDYWGDSVVTNRGSVFASGKIGNSIDFDDTTDNVNATGVLGLTEDKGAISFWIYKDTTTTANSRAVVKVGVNTPTVYNYGTFVQVIWPGSSGMPLGGGEYSNQVYLSPATGAWHHVVFTWDTDEYWFYQNNILDDYNGSNSFGAIPADTYVSLGGGWDNAIDGKLDEVMIWNKTLSASEVEQLYYGSKYGGNMMNSSQTSEGDIWKLGVRAGDSGNTFGAERNSSEVTILAPPCSEGMNGLGTSASPCNITSCVQLQGMEDNLTNDYQLVNDVNCDVAPYNTGDGFDPVGQSSYFAGNFNGNNYAITGLYVNRSGESYVGLFGMTSSNSEIKNVGLKNVYITGKVAGGLVGVAAGYIENSFSTGEVIGVAVDGSGGLVGYLTGSSGDIAIVNTSYSECDVSGTYDTGGLVGWASYGNVYDSYATGEVTAPGGSNRAGGLVGGGEDSAVYDSYATGNVNGGDYVGGLVGGLSISVHNSNATGDVFGDAFVGGLIGWMNSEDIFNSHATGNVIASQNTAGGFVARLNGGNIINCSATGNVTGTWDNTAGFVGRFRGGTINNSYATGNVTGTAQVGGFVGYTDTTTTKKIHNCYATGNVIGNTIAGFIDFIESTTDIEIRNCYATGNVNSTTAAAGFARVLYDGSIDDSYSTGEVEGGIAGGFTLYNFGGSITNVYWLNNTGDDAVNCTYGSVEDCTTETDESVFFDVANTHAVYTNWDFTNIWDDVYDDGDYPPLQWQNALPLPCSKGMNGLGTASNPCNITTCIQLQGMEDNLTNDYQLVNDVNCSETSGWNSGDGFDPVGEGSSNPFSGTLDGQGYKITNLYINRSSDPRVGLFDTSKGSIKNLTLENINMTGDSSVGGLISNANGGTRINNINITGFVSASGHAGGLISQIFENTYINNSYSSVNVTGTSWVGGLVGFAENVIIITNCHTTSDVTGTNDEVGGLIGTAYSGIVITNCSATGQVSGDDKVGGLVGNVEGPITNSYATGDVSGSSDYIGGLVGYSVGGDINNSYSTGNVSGNDHVGGLIGRDGGTIENSYATGNVIGSSSIAGGLAGYTREGHISNSYSTGKVTAPTLVGGLIGFSDLGWNGANVYWLNHTDDDATSCGPSSGRTGCTAETSESVFFDVANTHAVYINWDFTNIWDVAYDEYDYPRFRSEILVPASSEFTGTDFEAVSDLESVSGMILTTGNATIIWLNDVSAEAQNYNKYIEFGEGFISVNSSALDTSINTSANITINNVTCALFDNIYYSSGFYTNFSDVIGNGAVCNSGTDPSCTNVDCTGSTLTFIVSHFSGFAANEAAPATPAGGSTGGSGGSSKKTCEEDWECSAWGECLEGIQSRICEDLNNCQELFDQGSVEEIITTTKPYESQACAFEECIDDDDCPDQYECKSNTCVYEEPKKKPAVVEKPKKDPETIAGKGFDFGGTGSIIALIIFLAVMVILIGGIYRVKYYPETDLYKKHHREKEIRLHRKKKEAELKALEKREKEKLKLYKKERKQSYRIRKQRKEMEIKQIHQQRNIKKIDKQMKKQEKKVVENVKKVKQQYYRGFKEKQSEITKKVEEKALKHKAKTKKLAKTTKLQKK